MSQIFKSVAGGGGGGSPIMTVTGDSGGPVPPTANNINLVGGSSSVNNTNGITVVGNAGTSTETFTLTNRQSATVQTTDATPTTLLTFTTANIQGVYDLDFSIIAFSSGSFDGAVFHVQGTIIADGAGNIGTIGIPTISVDGSLAYDTNQIGVTTSGLNVILSVTGTIAKTIRWTALLTYEFGGA